MGESMIHSIILNGVHSAVDKEGLARAIQQSVKGKTDYKYLDPCLNVSKKITAEYKTVGHIIAEVLEKERMGDYKGGTVQVTPHITEEIRNWIVKTEAKNTVTVIGGNVGDLENQLAIEAVREMTLKEDVRIVMYVPVPYLRAAGEIKTKPVQHSVKELMRMGIIPYALCLKSDMDLRVNEIKKIALFTGVPSDRIVWHTNGLGDCGKKLARSIYNN
jgi:CTP synthase (UTP-ammonia lyase)